MEITLIFCLCFCLLCRRGKNEFEVNFRRIGPYLFLSQDGKDAVREGKMDGEVFISRQSRHLFNLINNMIKVLFPVCTLIWRVKKSFPPRKSLNRRDESTIIVMKHCDC